MGKIITTTKIRPLQYDIYFRAKRDARIARRFNIIMRTQESRLGVAPIPQTKIGDHSLCIFCYHLRMKEYSTGSFEPTCPFSECPSFKLRVIK